MYTTTYEGLHHWHNHEFEHLGWMTLAYARGDKLKIKVYKDSIDRLEKAILYKIEAISDLDKKQDLEILLDHTRTLKQAIRVLFK